MDILQSQRWASSAADVVLVLVFLLTDTPTSQSFKSVLAEERPLALSPVSVFIPSYTTIHKNHSVIDSKIFELNPTVPHECEDVTLLSKIVKEICKTSLVVT